MGLHHTAHYLKTKGRDGDTELVHMTKGEVKGLQALALAHGGSLTINPDTGLPEANFLKRALPTIAGIGVGVATGNPMLGSAVAGGLTMATGGSLIQGLMAGVGAYGGAGMVSSLAEAGATQVAAEVAPAAIQQQAVTSGLPEVVSAAQTTPASINAAAEAMANLPPAMPPVLPAAQTTAASIDAAANAMANMPPTSPIQSGTPLNQVADMYNKGQLTTEQYTNYANAHEAARQKAMQSPFSSAFRGLGVGGPQGFSPTTGFTNLYDIVKRDPTQAAMAAAPLLTNMDTEERGAPGPADSGYASSISPNFQAYVPAQPNPYYQAQYPDYRRRTYAAEGGIMQSYQAGGPVERMSMMNTAMNPQGGLYPMGMIDKTQYATPTQRPVSAELVTEAPAYERSNPMLMNTGGAARLPKGDPGLYRDTDPSTRGLSASDAEAMRRKKLMGRFGIPMAEMPKTGIKSLGGDMSDMAAAGGIASLGGYSDGGRMLKGPGDGMSDSIPASIGNKQPARLADGEFVVPADVVSHLGNGSTDAGARKLYSMMDKIRKARTGKKRQAPAVKVDKYMPA
jgi:hypothetical protein